MSSKTLMTKVSLPYAEALLELAKETKEIVKITEDVKMINQVLLESSNLNIFLINPLVSTIPKKEVLKKLFSGQLSDNVLNFLLVLIDRKRSSFITSILSKYLELANNLESITVAQITSSIELTEDQQIKLISKLKEITKSNEVRLEMHVDPNLIGGFIIQMGSKVIDASVRGQIQEMAAFLAV